MVKDWDIHDFSCFDQTVGNGDIFTAGAGISAGMIVAEDDGCGMVLDGRQENLTGMDDGSLQGTDAHILDGDDMILGIQADKGEMLFRFVAEPRHDGVGNILGPVDDGDLAFRFPHHQTAGHFLQVVELFSPLFTDSLKGKRGTEHVGKATAFKESTGGIQKAGEKFGIGFALRFFHRRSLTFFGLSIQHLFFLTAIADHWNEGKARVRSTKGLPLPFLMEMVGY